MIRTKQWKKAEIQLRRSEISGNFQVEFLGQRGDGPNGEIAIDDILIQEQCATEIWQCNFEKECNFNQSTNDNFDWVKKQYSTLTVGTGPSYDHTFGRSNGQKGFYIYIDSSFHPSQKSSPSHASKQGDKASLVSPEFPLRQRCNLTLHFFYNMYGTNIGELDIEILAAGNDVSSL